MEKLTRLGLAQSQPTRPKMFAALPAEAVVSRAIDIARERAERFAADASGLREALTGLRARVRGRQPFLDLALGMDGHVRRHLVPLRAARTRIFSYMEAGDLAAINAAIDAGFPILRRIARNTAEHGVEHRVVFGFSYRSAKDLVDFSVCTEPTSSRSRVCGTQESSATRFTSWMTTRWSCRSITRS